MVSDAKKTKRQRSAAAQDASSEPKPKKAKAAKGTKSSTLTQAAAQAVPAAAQAATSRQTLKIKKPSTPAAAAAQAAPVAAEAATSCQAAELKALLARLRKPNGLVLTDRQLDDACTMLGLPVGKDKNKLTKVNIVRTCITKVTVAREDDFIQERIAQDAAALEEARQVKKKPVKSTKQAKSGSKKPVKTAAANPTAVDATTAMAGAKATERRTTAQDKKVAITERRTINTAPDAEISAWFPIPDYTYAADDYAAVKNVARHQIRFSDADFLETRGELPPPDFRGTAALGPLADLRRKSNEDFPFPIPGPPVDENQGMMLGAPSQQE